jgi:hypothetical protein
LELQADNMNVSEVKRNRTWNVLVREMSMEILSREC